MKKMMQLFVVFAAVACTVVMSNNVSAQELTHSSDVVAQTMAANATDAVMSLAGQMTALRTQIAEVEKRCASATGSARRKLEKELEEMKKKLEELGKKTALNCAAFADKETQEKCLGVLEAITAGGEAAALKTFAEVAKPAPVSTQTAGESTTTTYGRGGGVPYTKMMRCSGGDVPVCTSLQVGEPTPIPPIRFEEENGGVHPIVKWLVPVAAGALAGGAIAGMADPDGPDGGNYSFGSAGKGAMLGAATGLVVSLIWEIAD